MSFKELDLLPQLLKNVNAAGYTTPTPIQERAIPPALAGRDVLGTAQTGTGKTAAFSLPILQRLDALATNSPVLRTLVLTPTRELAAQIGESFRVYGQGMDLWHTVVFGGVNIKPQIRTLGEGVDALVATPGRLLDLLGQRALTLRNVEIFVLDEADRMLDMGFLPDVRRVIRELPEKRQTLFFSATMPPEIRSLTEELLHEPAVVSVKPESPAAEAVEQHVFFVDRSDKQSLLVDLLRDGKIKRTLVFTRTKHGANKLARRLLKADVEASAIHGNKSQSARTRALDSFRSGELRVLVATDLAARGIDVDDVSHVINFDLPNVPETYVHRIGRTGRAHRSGIALSLCDIEERPYLEDIERLLGEHVNRVESHGYPPSQALPAATDLEAGKGSRPKRPAKPGAGRGRPRRRGGGARRSSSGGRRRPPSGR